VVDPAQVERPRAPLRDATLATLALVAAIGAGSGGFATIDPALLGYLGATVVAVFGVSWRMSAFWRRPASAFYARALVSSLGRPRRLYRTAAFAHRDLIAQGFIRRRSVVRWIAHLSLSLGTLASFVITIPLVCGWMYFVPTGERQYRMVLLTVPTLRFDLNGSFAWIVFHALSVAAVAVVLGGLYFLAVRLRARRLPGSTASFAIAPLLLLLLVAVTGLALPASRDWPGAFRIAALLHQASVVVLLVAIPFSKLGHVLIRPLQLGARAIRANDAAWANCAGCGAPLAPAAQQQAVAALLAQRGMHFTGRLDRCPSCRRRQLSAAQSALIDGKFQPRVMGGQGGS
jgi:hypothetical protein